MNFDFKTACKIYFEIYIYIFFSDIFVKLLLQIWEEKKYDF